MFKKIAQMIKTYQAMPPQGMPPMDPAMAGQPMPPQGAPVDPAAAGQPMPPQGAPMDPAMAGQPQVDPLLDQLMQVFGQLPPGMFSQLVAMPTDQLVELAKQGQIPPAAVQLILYLRMSGPESGMGDMDQGQEEAVKESAVKAIRGLRRR